jgi:dTMP kinase
MRRELFISFEGIDKSGKTTQISRLANYLKKKGYEVVKTCEPGGTELGKKIKEILLSSHYEMNKTTELFLYLADRAEHVEKVIKPALSEGKIVISDRFADATAAYQGYGRGINIDWIEKLNRIVTQGLSPDITFLLDINPFSARQRSKTRDRMENEEIDFHRRVRQGYLLIAKSFPERVHIIKGDRSTEEIFSIIINELSKYIGK